MEVESSICLSDLVPALRWSRPQQVAEALGDPRLPAGWWSSLALSKALGTAGLDWICERLARLASSRWDHLPLADLLPALAVHAIDPALPGWSEATRTAVTGLGGWQRLRRLSPSDLGTPSATPEVVINSVFREILSRIPAQREAPAAVQAGHPEVTRPLQRGTTPASISTRGTGSFPAQPDSAPQTGTFAALGAPFPAPTTEAPPVPAQKPGEGLFQRPAGTTPGQQSEQRQTGAFPAQSPESSAQRQPGSFPAQSLNPAQSPNPAQAPNPAQSPNQRQTGSFPAQSPESTAQRQTGSFPAVPPAEGGSQRQTGSFPAQGPRQSFAGEGLQQRSAGPGQSERLPQRPGGPQPSRQEPSGGPQTGSIPAVPGTSSGGPHTGSIPPVPGGAQNGTAPGSGGPQTGSMPAIPGTAPGGPQTGSIPAVPGTGGPHTGSIPPVPGAGGPHTGSIPPVPGSEAAKGAPAAFSTPVPSAAPSSPAPTDADHAMVRVVDNLFRSLDKLELAVAVHRLFAEDPVSLRTLAHKMLVERDALSHAQRTAEERVLHWLRSSESAPVTGHMFRLTEWLGAAATEDQLIGADPAHPVTVPSLRTPLWRVLVTLMPDRRLQDGWLVVGDIHGLQARTRQLLATSPPDADVVALMGELGIRAHSAQAWFDALPSEEAQGQAAAADSPALPLPRRTPGANGHHHRGGQPIPAATAGSIDPSAALATLSALSGGRSSMIPAGLAAGTPSTPPPPLPSPSSDPRRWQRIEVTPEHLRGGPVPVPEGYAAQLGMRPGTLLSVTGPGDNAIVLVWQGHQPVFDSLQPVLMRLNARPGDQVYVTVDGYRLEAQLTG
ncbi:hypothetical protein SAMN05444920_102405 [Nonomuraea solani]|uniref:Uncharacterized protein n=1 Tax=Nonomuraea solani TaxID=1144553 RepID=A0A1H5YUK4_9ACTN|nr:hypothetical protein [Nonomuraea solani]SEG27147.1 hypothetical protein SAMN05444920_102405 [Nonomuraea solani]